MLRRKCIRDIKENKSQFITIFLMVLIGIMVYVGIESYMGAMTDSANKFYTDNNLQDLNVLGINFTNEDIDSIKNISNVEDAEGKLTINAINALDNDKTYLVNFIESNNISKFYIVDGISFDKNLKGAWLDNFYANENNLKVGDTIKIKYDTYELEEPILGLINVPDHIYDVKDESQLLPNHENYGFVYLSINELPNITYNYIMVDVNNKNNVDQVKNDIEDNISTLAVIKIEDTTSYSMYQGEIDEGTAYIGIFSGLFLFIALLSVITTMTRVIKKQRIQIGTLKALGFKKYKIVLHYISYGFWVSLIGAICGIFAGKYFIGTIFLNMEMDYFELPSVGITISKSCYIMAILTVLCISLVTYLTCIKELMRSPADSLRNELPKVKKNSLNITSKGIFKKMNFKTIWNIRDILRNKFRTITAIIGVTGCCMLIVCALGMLNSMNHFIELQFDDLYNFNYKLVLKENITEEEINELESIYGSSTSATLGIEIKLDNGNREQNNIFVYDASNYIRFKNNSNKYINLDNDNGIYVTYKLAELNNYKLGDTITWHIYGDNTYYKSKIIGFNKDPQNQNITMTSTYLESLNIKYIPDSIYTNADLSNIKEINNVEMIQDIESLKESISNMLSMMKEMICIIIIFAILLGGVIIYNMGVLSFNEKQYQFATLKVLGFKDKKIKNIYIKQNNWISIISIIIGLPLGYYLLNWIFVEALDESYDFNAHINISTYILAAIGTYLISYIVSLILSKKVSKIDMVTSLKGNE
jgi:putative ABC transport system permease protein